MRKMVKVTKTVVTLVIAFAMLLGLPGTNLAMLSNGLNQVQAASEVSRTSIHDGAILHAFCWNFNTIKENMPEIAAAGYTAVQTSPINDCLSTEPGLTLYGDDGKWYYHYQPTDWTIGNYQLGTRDEFKAMCDEADKYGIGIIVDIDPNHTTPVFGEISESLLNAVGATYDDVTNLYHVDGADVSRTIDYSNRVSVVYDPMGGLPDVDTENPDFQNYFYGFLEDCIDCGADGFRIDTAKHIALPDDGVPSAYAGQEDRNNFYPNMKSYIDDLSNVDYADLFVYGEVLQGDTARLDAYQEMLGGTTASNYGSTIRSAVSSGSLSVSKIESYGIEDTADSDKLVTWVESHDNYINDKSYNTVDDTDVVLAWAIICARQDGTPLFFSRPDGSSSDNPWGNNVLGAAGSDLYLNPQVVAVNKFRTAMVGESETLRNPDGNNSVLMVERGTKGAVIINDSDDVFDLESETNLADGTYINSVEGEDSLFTVSDGIITGKIAANSVVVLDKQAEVDYSTLFFFNSKGWSSVSALACGTSYTCDNTGDGWYKVTIPSQEFEVTFTDGTNTSKSFSITKSSGRYMTGSSDKIFATKAEAEAEIGVVTTSVYFYNTNEWSTVKAYAWLEDGTQIFGAWPGVTAKNEGDYWWRADVKLMSDSDFYIIFNNGNGSQTQDISITDKSKTFITADGEVYASKEEAMEGIGIYPDKTTVYFYNTKGWDQVGVYVWGAASLGDWPGQVATDEGDNWWSYTVDAAPGDDFNIIFNNCNNGGQTADLKVTSIKNVYFWGSNWYSSKSAAEDAYEASLGTEAEESEEEKAIDTEPELTEGQVRVYYHVDSSWNEAYMYAWLENDAGESAGQPLGEWPGTKMSHIGNNWYSINISKDLLSYGEEDEVASVVEVVDESGDSDNQIEADANVDDQERIVETSSDDFEEEDELEEDEIQKDQEENVESLNSSLSISRHKVYVVAATSIVPHLIINDNGIHGQINDAETLITLDRPSDEELGINTEVEENESEKDSSNSSNSSSGADSSLSTDSSSSTSSSSYVASNKTTTENSEDDVELNDVEEITDTKAVKEEATSIDDTETPEAGIKEESSKVLPMLIIVLGAAFVAAGAGLTFKFKKNK